MSVDARYCRGDRRGAGPTPASATACPRQQPPRSWRETMAGTAALLAARHDTLAMRRAVTSPGGSPRAGSRRSSAGACGRRSDARRGAGLRDLLAARAADRRLPQRAAPRLHAHHHRLDRRVLVFSLGARIPYSRPLNAVLDFLRDSRALPAALPPAPAAGRPARPHADRRDPRAAVAGGIVVEPDRARVSAPARPRAARGAGHGGGDRARPGHEGDRALAIVARRARGLFLGSSSINVRNTGVAFSMFSGGGTLRRVRRVIAWSRCSATSSRTPSGRWCGCRPACCSAARLGNLIDRVRVGAVTDFIKLPGWPAFNVADMAITFGVLALLYVLERRAK